MHSIHVYHCQGGWVVTRRLEEKPALVIETKSEAMKVARGIESRYPGSEILLYVFPGTQPIRVVPIKRKKAGFRQ